VCVRVYGCIHKHIYIYIYIYINIFDSRAVYVCVRVYSCIRKHIYVCIYIYIYIYSSHERYMCVCACMAVYTNIFIYTYIYIYIRLMSGIVCVHACIAVHANIFIYIYIHLYSTHERYMCVCACIAVHADMYIHTHIYKYIRLTSCTILSLEPVASRRPFECHADNVYRASKYIIYILCVKIYCKNTLTIHSAYTFWRPTLRVSHNHCIECVLLNHMMECHADNVYEASK